MSEAARILAELIGKGKAATTSPIAYATVVAPAVSGRLDIRIDGAPVTHSTSVTATVPTSVGDRVLVIKNGTQWTAIGNLSSSDPPPPANNKPAVFFFTETNKTVLNTSLLYCTVNVAGYPNYNSRAHINSDPSTFLPGAGGNAAVVEVLRAGVYRWWFRFRNSGTSGGFDAHFYYNGSTQQVFNEASPPQWAGRSVEWYLKANAGDKIGWAISRGEAVSGGAADWLTGGLSGPY